MKIADAGYTSRGFKYFVVTTAGTSGKNNRNYYTYNVKGMPKRGVKVKTFWEIIGIDKSQTELHNLGIKVDKEFRDEAKIKRKKEKELIKAEEALASKAK